MSTTVQSRQLTEDSGIYLQQLIQGQFHSSPASLFISTKPIKEDELKVPLVYSKR